MNTFHRIWDFLASRRMAIALLTAASIYYLILLVFSIIASRHNADNISQTYPFLLLYLLFYINIGLCIYRWLPTLKLKLTTFPLKHGSISEHHPVFISGDKSIIVNRLRKRGYKVVDDSGERKYLVKGRYSPIGGLLFHLSLFPIFIGIVISINTRFIGETLMVDGQPFWGMPDEDLWSSAKEPDSMPKLSLSVDKIEADFWEDKQLFTKLTAIVRFPADTLKNQAIMKISDPVVFGDTYVRIAGMGYTISFEAGDKEGYLIDKGIVKLNVFAPGSEDSFSIGGLPHKVYLKVYPDYYLVDGKLNTKTFYPKNPAYYIKIVRGKLILYEGPLLASQEVKVDDFILRLPKVGYWGQVQIVRDGGARFVFAGFILMIAGLVWRFVWYRRDIMLIPGPEGGTNVIGFAEYFPKGFVEWLKKMGRK